MGRNPCCSKIGLKRGSWTASEDKILTDYITLHGQGKWRQLPIKAGLMRCGKSCRLRWLNYLKPDIKRGNISCEEEDLIIRLHKLLGNRWSLIAGRLPGRTDNEIKNYWNTTLAKKMHINEEQNLKKKKDMTKSVVSIKAVKCSTHLSQQVEPPRSNFVEPPNFDHEENMTCLNLDASMDGLHNTDFMDSMFKLNDDRRLASTDDMMSTVGDSDSMSKEILDYFTSEIGGEWLSSL